MERPALIASVVLAVELCNMKIHVHTLHCNGGEGN